MFSNGCSVIAGFLFIYNKKAVHFWTTFCKFWQGHKDLNPEPTVLETAALPIELYPYVFYSKRNETLALWWAFRDSNPGLSGYEPEALTN